MEDKRNYDPNSDPLVGALPPYDAVVAAQKRRSEEELDEVDLNYVLVALQYMRSAVLRRKPDVEYYLGGSDEDAYVDSLDGAIAKVLNGLLNGGRR